MFQIFWFPELSEGPTLSSSAADSFAGTAVINLLWELWVLQPFSAESHHRLNNAWLWRVTSIVSFFGIGPVISDKDNISSLLWKEEEKKTPHLIETLQTTN